MPGRFHLQPDKHNSLHSRAFLPFSSGGGPRNGLDAGTVTGGGSKSQSSSPGTSTLLWQITCHPPAILFAPSEVAAHLKRPIAALYLLRLPLVGYGPKKVTLHVLTHGTMRGCGLTYLVACINDKKL